MNRQEVGSLRYTLLMVYEPNQWSFHSEEHCSRFLRLPWTYEGKNDVLTHKLQLIVRWPPRLRKTKTPLDALQKFPRNFITHDMRRPFITLV